MKSASVSSNSTLMPKPYRGRLKTENLRACFEARTLPMNLEIYAGYGLLSSIVVMPDVQSTIHPHILHYQLQNQILPLRLNKAAPLEVKILNGLHAKVERNHH